MRTFRSTRPGAGWLLILALSPAPVLAETAARVDFAAGDITVTTAQGASHGLKKGDLIEGGDRIQTGHGRVQLRFLDGAYVALQPNTVFKVDEYLFANKPAGQQSAFFSLVKGGMRTVTGSIGKANRDNYRITTPVATIGIRGTAYTAEQTADTLHVTVNSGLVAVMNGLGEVVAGVGQNIDVQAGQRPNLSEQQTHLNSGQQEEQAGETTEEEHTETTLVSSATQPELNPCYGDHSGTSVCSTQPGLLSTTTVVKPLALAYAYHGNSPTLRGYYAEEGKGTLSITTDSRGLGSATLASQTLLSRTDASLNPAATETGAGQGQYLHGGSWGGGNAIVDGTVTPIDPGLHYIYGEMTPLAAMSALTGSLHYQLIGASHFTDHSGSSTTHHGSLDAASGLDVNFGLGAMSVYLLMHNFINDGSSFTIKQGGNNITWLSTNGTRDARFSLAVNGSQDSSCTGCTTTMTGFFAGPNAEELGIAYGITVPSVGQGEGVAGFGQGPIPIGQGLAVASASNPRLVGHYTNEGVGILTIEHDSQGYLVDVIKAGHRYIDRGQASQGVQGTTAGLVWGSWGPGTIAEDINGTLTASTLSDPHRLHYVYGDLTPIADMQALAQVSGKISYSLAAATAVTDANPQTSLATGTLGSGSALAFDFSLGTVDATLVFQNFAGISSQTLAASNQGVYWGSNTSAGGPASDARFKAIVNDASCTTACTRYADIYGFFSGAQAKAVGLSYYANLNGNTAEGAAVFTKP